MSQHSSYIPHTVSLFLMRDDGMCLVISRRDDDEDFGLVGGKVEYDETLAAACAREAREEAGLGVSDLVPVFTRAEASRIVEGRRYMNTAFVAGRVTGSPARQPNEPRLAWASPRILLFGSYAAYNLELLRKLSVDPGIDAFAIELASSCDGRREWLRNACLKTVEDL